MYKEYDLVKLKTSLNEHNLIAGMMGVVLIVYDASPPVYEVEFCDNEGMTIALLTLDDNVLERMSIKK
jgi:hypothetical protein